MSSATSLTINNGKTSATRVNDLDKYTKYEFQVLAFTSAGDGPNSSVVFRKTMEDGENQKCLNQHSKNNTIIVVEMKVIILIDYG